MSGIRRGRIKEFLRNRRETVLAEREWIFPTLNAHSYDEIITLLNFEFARCYRPLRASKCSPQDGLSYLHSRLRSVDPRFPNTPWFELTELQRTKLLPGEQVDVFSLPVDVCAMEPLQFFLDEFEHMDVASLVESSFVIRINPDAERSRILAQLNAEFARLGVGREQVPPGPRQQAMSRKGHGSAPIKASNHLKKLGAVRLLAVNDWCWEAARDASSTGDTEEIDELYQKKDGWDVARFDTAVLLRRLSEIWKANGRFQDPGLWFETCRREPSLWKIAMDSAVRRSPVQFYSKVPSQDRAGILKEHSRFLQKTFEFSQFTTPG